MSRNLYLIGYDASEPSVQQKLLKSIKSYAIGGQKSFYECWMTESELNLFRKDVEFLINSKTDSVLIFQLNPRIKPRIEGQHQRIAFNPFLII